MLRAVGKAAAWTTGGIAVVSGASAAALAYEYGPEILPRIFAVYRDAIPCTIDYKGLQFCEENFPSLVGVVTAKSYDELHEKWSKRMLDTVFKTKGFFLKGGQLVASNYAGVFPELWTKTFSPVLDQQPHLPWEEIKPILERELKEAGHAAIEDVFSSFDTKPFAAASIGQVHRATLKDSGEKVVVKIQYPGVEAQFRGDVAMTKTFYQVVLPEQAGVFEEVERQFVNEFDYRREAEQMELVRTNLLAKDARELCPNTYVPRAHLKLCTKNMMTMEEVVGGVKLTEALEDDMKGLAAYQKRSVEALLDEERAANALALKQGWLRSGPDAAAMSKAIKGIQASNFFLKAARKPTIHVPLNHAALVDELILAHGYQFLINGAGNGDCHPGNVSIVRDADGTFKKMALLDFGQVKRWTTEQRLQMSRLVIALARADHANPQHRAAVASLGRSMGLKTEKSNDEVTFKLGVISFDRDDPLFLEGVNAAVFMERLAKLDKTVSMPNDFVMCSRASFMLRGLGHILNQHRSVAKLWEPLAERALREAGENPDNILPPLPLPKGKTAVSAASIGTPAPASTLAAST